MCGAHSEAETAAYDARATSLRFTNASKPGSGVLVE